MAYEASQPLKLTLKASVDMSAKQYTFVYVNSSGTASLCTQATDIPIGVLQNKPYTNGSAEIVVTGVTKVYADEALDEGNLIGTSTDGQAAVRAAGTDTTSYIVGQVIYPAGAAGRVATAVINCASPSRGA